MKKIIVSLSFLLLPFIYGTNACSQSDAPLYLVSLPTAGSLPAKTYMTGIQLFDGGGVVNYFTYGVSELLNLGISYGGANIIGSSKVVWQPHVGFNARVRIVEETVTTPAFSIGFDSQGDGPYIPGDGYKRFRIKSRGGYVMLSRNYSLLGTLGFHGGVNYSTECKDRDYGADFWGGLDKSLGNNAGVCAEYIFGRNDDENPDVKKRNGYLNAALKININKSFFLEFDLKNLLRDDILTDRGDIIRNPQPSREIRIIYKGSILN